MAKKVLQDMTDHKVMSFKEAAKALNWTLTEDDEVYTVSCDCGNSKIEYTGVIGVFIQKPLDEGITIEEITELVGRLECEQVIPIEVQANSSCAIGFISLDAAEELDYDYDNLIRNVSEVIEDMDNETEYGNYDFDGFPVYIGY